MRISEDKKQKKLERFFMTPNYTAVLGLTVNKDTDIEDGFTKEENGDEMTVKQKIHGTKFITEKSLKVKLSNGERMIERSRVEVSLKEGTRLIWIEGKGYVLPGESFQTITEIKKDVDALQDLALEGE